MLKRHVRVDGWGLLVHRLVQELTRLRLGADGRRPRLEHALELTDAVAVGDPQDVRTWPVWDALAPHVRVLVAHADEAGMAEPTARLMNDLGLHSKSKALFAEAEPLYRRALAIDERVLGPDHPDTAISLNNLAVLYEPREADGGRAADRRRWRFESGCWVRTTPTPPPPQQPGRLYAGEADGGRAALSPRWRFGSVCWVRTTPTPPKASTTWPHSTIPRGS